MDHGDGVDRDANGYAYDDGVHERAKKWQKVDNEDWPAPDVAARSRDREPHEWIAVRVRVVLERDGEAWLDGDATRWIGQRVCCRVGDRRLQVGWVWVNALDVKRRVEKPDP